jgi:phosphoribosylanthranilate isomerase
MTTPGGRAPGGQAGRAPRRTLVKVCGLTRLEDARWALECGADWLGFIVHAGGPRRIEPERMAAIVDELPAKTGWRAVAVMADAGPDEALALAQRAHAHRVQLHRQARGGTRARGRAQCAARRDPSPEGAAEGQEGDGRPGASRAG